MFKTVISFNVDQLILMSKQISNRYKPDIYTFHKFVYSLFPVEMNAKFSFNRELIRNGKRYLIIQSDKMPIFPEYILKNQINTFEYNDDFFENKEFKFIIDINSSKKSIKDRKFHPIKAYEINDWINNKFLAKNLFVKDINLISQKIDIFKVKNDHKVTVYHSKIIGKVKSNDKNALINAMINGIGHEKCYGYGMLILN